MGYERVKVIGKNEIIYLRLVFFRIKRGLDVVCV